MQTKRRSWFRIHLSTAMVLMLMFGCWMLVQLTPTIGSTKSNFMRARWDDPPDFPKSCVRTPHIAVKLVELSDEDAASIGVNWSLSPPHPIHAVCFGWPCDGFLAYCEHGLHFKFICYRGILFNVCIVVGSLLAVCFILERRIGRNDLRV